MIDLNAHFDGIAQAACECIEFTPCASLNRRFDYEFDDERFMEGDILCESDSEEVDEISRSARGLYVELRKLSFYGFKCSRSEINALYERLSEHIAKYFRENFKET